MEKEFIPYEQALALKELGFDENCFGYYETQDENLIINFNNLPLTEEQKKRPGLYTIYNSNGALPQWALAVPLYQQAFRWFREKHNLHNGIYPYYDDYKFQIDDFRLTTSTPVEGGLMKYEEAELSCLIKLIEIAKKF